MHPYFVSQSKAVPLIIQKSDGFELLSQIGAMKFRAVRWGFLYNGHCK